jgi:putative transposase
MTHRRSGKRVYQNRQQQSWTARPLRANETTQSGHALVKRRIARVDIFDRIECIYNPTRRHSTRGNKSPIDFEPAIAA